MIDVLRSLESEFRRIGDLAPVLRAEVEGVQKSQSGDAAVDVVTAADFRLQEEYLRLFIGTPLAGCRLWAEESNEALAELATHFRGDNGLYLCLDPIDGTQRFVENTPYYSSIVSLHDGTRPLYSWIYYPKLSWWMRIAGDDIAYGGEEVHESIQTVPNTVVYTAGVPDQDCPDWRDRLAIEGLGFKRSREIGPYGAKYLFIRGKVAGYFVARPNPYDGLVAYHFALAQGWPIWEERPASGFTALERDARGLHYAFRYLVRRPAD